LCNLIFASIMHERKAPGATAAAVGGSGTKKVKFNFSIRLLFSSVAFRLPGLAVDEI